MDDSVVFVEKSKELTTSTQFYSISKFFLFCNTLITPKSKIQKPPKV